MLTPGMKVKVYQQPYTDEEFEEEGMLVEKIDRQIDEPGFETWDVKFPSDPGETFVRTIKVQ